MLKDLSTIHDHTKTNIFLIKLLRQNICIIVKTVKIKEKKIYQ